MKVDDILATARDSITVRRVYAEPIERDGTTVIPAAKISGGGGGGAGTDEEGKEGSGGGFGIGAKPVGAYVLENGRVHWRPAIDANRLMLVIGAVVIVAIAAGVRLAKWPTAD
ncbi:putative spore protein YtfJ [Nocardia transvalensis]|uniref:Putative spore protein YtfJ n=1 Tax=Nocardia transvalensis TaxID=37333 RepID=A0A7W9PJ95_9NOCA|nr:spore germination protein GerW family protein [Nocardia transvalensis]MBB5916738.1 putative spore protein YtfJ [Nocardia transvalensis]